MKNVIVEIMDDIVEELSDVAESFSYFAKNAIAGIVFVLILITLPLWILPFLIWKHYREKDDEDGDWDEYTSATR
jgi:hypothetical protein